MLFLTFKYRQDKYMSNNSKNILIISIECIFKKLFKSIFLTFRSLFKFNKKIKVHIITNINLGNNPSFDVMLQWKEEKNNDSEDKYVEYSYFLCTRKTNNKWFNIDKAEYEISSEIKRIKEKHPNVQIIGHRESLNKIRNEFRGLYYDADEIEEYKRDDEKYNLLED